MRFHAYRNYPEDIVDAVFIGTSGVDRYWIAAKAYEEYGMTVYPLATDAMPAWLYPNVIEYALTYQNPQFLILDVRAFTQVNDADSMDVRARRVLDSMQTFSPVWFKTAFKSMEMIHSVDESRARFDISLLLSFVRFHDSWESMGPGFFAENLGYYTHEYNGFFVSPSLSGNIEAQQPQKRSDYAEPIESLSLQALYDVLALAEEKEIKVLFVDTPQFQDELEMLRSNYLYDLLNQMGIDCLNWYTDEPDGSFSIALDPERHFYNAGHVNFYGAEVFTEDFAAYINEHYPLPDRRNDEAVKELWDGVYEEICAVVSTYVYE